MNWRRYADWAKHRPLVLRVADQLGRGRGRLRPLDRLGPPPPPAPVVPDLSDWTSRRLSAVWVGHATVLVRIGGLTVLTDPVFSTRIGLGFGLMTVGPRRLCQPALSIRKLPPIDLILVSHAHFDHLDRPSLIRLDRRIPVLTSPNNGDLIKDLGFRRVQEVEHGRTVRLGRLSITARQVKHWGPRVFIDTQRGYAAFLIDAVGERILFGGDSAFGDHFDDLRTRPPDLAILGIGAYNPYLAAHASPEQAWQMFKSMLAAHLLPMHHSTFRLSYEPVGEPMARLLAAAGDEGDRIVVRRIGESWTKK